MRITDLDAVLFDVGMSPLFFENRAEKRVAIPGRQVVVDLRREQWLGVVGAGYRLVPNREAVEFARQCASQLFENVKPEDLVVFNVDAPERGWYCRVDLMHKGYEVNVFKKEVYLPFVRMTNSYNGTRALHFDIGYCRKICLNGVIFEEETIEFSFVHSKGVIRKNLDFRIGRDRLEQVRARFTSMADRLHGFEVPQGMELPLLFKALGLPRLPAGKEIPKNMAARFRALRSDLQGRADRYFTELGRNGYALMNAATDFASRPPELTGFHREQHGLQKRAGTWAREFADLLAKNPKPDLLKHLDPWSASDFSRN